MTDWRGNLRLWPFHLTAFSRDMVNKEKGCGLLVTWDWRGVVYGFGIGWGL